MDTFPLMFAFGRKEDNEKKLVLKALQAFRDGDETNAVAISHLQGLDRDIAEVVNEIITRHQASAAEQFHQFNAVARAISNGDFSRKVTLEVKGEPLALKNTLNSLADSLTHLASEVTNLTCNVVQGKYGGSVVVPGARGSWKDIADNVNFIMSTFEEQMRAFTMITTSMAKGDFYQRLRIDVQGEPLELKYTFNTMMDFLNMFSSEITRILKFFAEGRFGETIERPEQYLEGQWLALATDVNAMSVLMNEQFKDVCASLNTAVAKGHEVSNLLTLKSTLDHIALTHLQVLEKKSSLRYVSGELRNPLNAVIGMSEMLLETPMKPEQLDMVNIIKTCGVSILSCMNDYTDFESLSNEYSSESTFSLREECEKVVCGCASEIQSVTFNLDIDARVPDSLIGNLHLFHTILLRFVNRFRYGFRGSVLVSILPQYIAGENLTLEVNVTDDGPRYSKDHLRDIMSCTVGDYNGFSMPIALRAVKQMKGTATAKSSEAKGNIFTFTLPLKVNLSTPQTTIPADIANRELLVVCGHTPTQQVIARTIAGLGVKPVITGNADEALGILNRPTEKSNYAAILVDSDVAANKKLLELVDTPILQMSSKYSLHSLDTKHLAKPVGPRSLLNALRTCNNVRKNPRNDVILAHSVNAKILCAARNPINRKILDHMLRTIGYTNLILVENGADVLLELKQGSFDIIFLDTVEDAFETTQTIRSTERPDQRNTIIGVTIGKREECIRAGMDGHLSKPISFPLLRDIVSQFLSHNGYKNVQKSADEKPDAIEDEFVLVDTK
jgi:osomolarity two-component system sensor histidine kinase NIK1